MQIARIVFTLVLVLSAACSKAGPPPPKDEIVEALEQPGVLILDVRSPEEWAGGHVEGAVNVPMDQLERVAEIHPDKEQQIIVHCAVGGRSAKATTALTEMGYTRILDAKTPESVAKALGKPLVK